MKRTRITCVSRLTNRSRRGRLPTVAPITTLVRDIPTEVELLPADGLPQRCAANFDNVFTIATGCLVEHIARLSDDRLDQVCAAFRFAAGC